VTKPVVVRSFLRVGEHGVRFLNLLEPVLRIFLVAAVGMIAPSQAPKRVLQGLFVRPSVNAEDLVVVTL